MSVAKGLEGIVATTSTVSSIIDGVLTYRGYPIDDLADHATYEEVVYLLLYGKLPSQAELDDFYEQISQYSSLPESVIEQMRLFPADANPMAVLRTVVSSLALYDPEAQDMSHEANLRKAIKLQTQIPVIIACYERLRKGKEPVQPKKNVSISYNFLYMLFGEEPEDVAVKALEKALILHADHELNASTFASRVTVATLSDIYSGVTSALGTLKGPLHGGANEAVMMMLEEIGEVSKVEDYINDKIEKKEKVMGFGHRVYKNGDPRARHLKKMALEMGKLTNNMKWYDMLVKIQEIVTGTKGLKPNVDFYSSVVYTSLGIPRDLFTPVFATSRISGWSAHILEQFENNRIIRPRAEYIGPKDQQYVPINNR